VTDVDGIRPGSAPSVDLAGRGAQPSLGGHEGPFDLVQSADQRVVGVVGPAVGELADARGDVGDDGGQ